MLFPDGLSAENVFSVSKVIPVIVIRDLDKAIPLASAILAGGVNVLEVTLRTPVALDAIKLLTRNFPDALIGAGTVINPEQLDWVTQAGAKFAISPGQTHSLLMAGQKSRIPLIPGIASVSELMAGLELGYRHFKLFPAAAVGGIQLLRAVFGPFPDVRFCPTGGVNEENFQDYLALPNVSCVGGSWIVPDQAIKNNEWALITELCHSISNDLYKVQ
ncbi:bifunctional 4-hydroxy-2-oxoglutarate aldolase/2-dehydro-3-deoxy-phosphogluconate aldolase [Legionella bononiensis]|uniref:2-dehydro-3-deoxy-phosphogluconate aldolase n=1 Tax=Legionella bononiensis TaxID=2793102 RepID=A0ABS1W962_9GAMM|nr:bifunctional 4-hydroxy-2-oxoglutarate aldolase/2-dehydro-3-deoxy-phosphogluconate aldolase [Legionella bononiensis]MBL7480921.1 bifunctional 4-hydroxy-2-oxoglutarate aldolase/2-dehydro-3-deoxy-phosphogluconate aldolase [Legionella bononiensis]MBL7525897.1 bifunctional 4-hydroxy-2-oxoglutarate aldolase/2-dehydro-3-deoxy-phosphogluconate aldolase [Legionella bononiensis]MBL7564036.1 bifunctional 4-hydroxy-2-oxoglutarate aldolase/2-dehydro-3-deoxy-phosphogluconate aldolase [Legionella bononiensi